jgi:phosphoserine phosphatase
LADRAGVAGESDHGIGMNEDFSESFKQRMALLFEEDAENGQLENPTITQGAHRLMKALKYYGFKTAILSGGFTYWEVFTKRIGYVHANELEIIDGKLTGKYLGILLTVQRSRVPKATKKKATSTKLLPW